jgi:transcriptional regulator with XRE-family HTH domain
VRRRATDQRVAPPKGKPPSGRAVLAGNVRRLRRERGWTQEFLADRAGLHWTYLSGIERGVRNASIDNVFKLAWALGVEAAELVGSA